MRYQFLYQFLHEYLGKSWTHRLGPPYWEILKIRNTDLKFPKVLDTAGRKTRKRKRMRRTQANAKGYAFHANTKIQSHLRELELAKIWLGDELFNLGKSKSWECQLFLIMDYISKYLIFLYLLSYFFLLLVLETSIKRT